MASKLQFYSKLADHTAWRITGSYQSWTDFLKTAARLYKYPYHEQLMIYAQRPEATACADYELWNRQMGRYVRRGAKGIALIDNSGDNPRIKYVFDVADTGGNERSRRPNLWEYRQEHTETVSAALNEKFYISNDSGIDQQLMYIASTLVSEYWVAHEKDILGILDGSHLDQYDDYDTGVAFLNAATVSTTYALLSRCGLDAENMFSHEDFMPVFDFNTPQTVAALGSAVSEISETVLRHIEVTIKRYDRQKQAERSENYGRTELPEERRLPDPGTEPAAAGADASGQVRQAAESLSEGAPPNPVEHHDPVREPVSPPSGDRPDGEQPTGADDAADGEASRRDGSPESQRPDEVDRPDEQPESPGGGNDPAGADLQLTEEPPETTGEQFTFFPSEAEQIQYIAEAESVPVTPSAFTFPQETIDNILRHGSNTRDARKALAAEFSKPRTTEELSNFVQKVYHDGFGLKANGQNVSVWYGEDGIRIAPGTSARYAKTAQVISWQDAASRIKELLQLGQFATNVEVTESLGYERAKVAESLWYLQRDLKEDARDKYLGLVRDLPAGFPSATEKLSVYLSEPESLAAVIREYKLFLDAYQSGEKLLRFRYHNPEKLMRQLNDLTLPRIEYPATMLAMEHPGAFITEDEINETIARGSNYELGNFRIYSYFTDTHTEKDKVDFLKKEYGMGGSSSAVSHCGWEDHSSKGMRLRKDFCADVEIPWKKVARRIDDMIRSDRYFSEEGKILYENIQTRSIQYKLNQAAYNEIKETNPDDIVLFQVGDFFEIYGEDARDAAKLLDLNISSRALLDVGRVEYCGIPANRLEEFVEKLRQTHSVTIAPLDTPSSDQKTYFLPKLETAPEESVSVTEPEPAKLTTEELFDKYKPLISTAISEDIAYRNACGHDTHEDAMAAGRGAINNVILASGDTQLIQMYANIPEFRHRLHREILSETYPVLHELLRPLSQEDIDNAIRAWNGNMDSKRAVVRYMAVHGRERDTAAWLSSEYGGDENSNLFIVRSGSPEATELSWPKVQRRIAKLIQKDDFFTEAEKDNYEDIDPIVIRDKLAERGIVNGEVVDEEKHNSSPFIQQVEADVRRIADEEFAKDHLIPGKSTFEIDGHTFLVDRVNLNHGSVNFQDITFANATGFPIFRTEPISFVRKLIKEQEAKLPPVPVPSTPNNEDPAPVETEPSYTIKTEEYIPGEKSGLPYDVVFQTISTGGPEIDPLDSTRNAVSIPVDGEWRSFPDTKSAEQAAYQEYKDNIRRNAQNFRIEDTHLGEGGPKAKFQANVSAIKLLKELEASDSQALPEQQEVLSRYVGWGGLADAFNPEKDNWKEEYAELKELLTPEEYAAARSSTLNAHYTSPTVIRAMYDAIAQMGFQTGNILEPSMGVGNFFGMLPEQMEGSRLYGVELDSITGRIAQQLYPKANITVAGFEKTDHRDFFDLAIGNVPFGQYQVNDPAYNRLGFSIHNYFLAKAMDQLRPGGVMAFVTSRYTMDAKNSDIRQYLAKRAELLGAIRLPNDAFKANAGTEVVSDILFLQKRDRPIEIEPDWVHLGENKDGYAINQYFLDNPHMVLGLETSESTRFGMDYTVAPREDIPLSQHLQEAVKHIRGTYVEAELPDLGEGEKIDDSIPADPDVKNFSYTLVDGEIYYRENSRMVKPQLNATAKERVKGMIGLRECVRQLIDLQMDPYTTDETIQEKQAELNRLYDAFSDKHGLINDRGNRLAFSDDSSYYLLCSLEVLDEDNKLERKADMFTKRTIRQAQAVTSVETASEALAVSIAERARVDMPFMASLSGKAEEELVSELRGVVFRLPEPVDGDGNPRYATADEYLSGNVRQKLERARQAMEINPDIFQDNVTALEAAQPEDLEASEIDVRLGATWIDKKYIQQFMEDLLNPPYYMRRSIQVNYSPYTAEWNISGKNNISYSDINAYTTYGTDRLNAYHILEDTLNLRDVRIYDTVEDRDGKEKRVLNQKETTLAQQKQQAIRDAFQDWIWQDPYRRNTLVTTYNELFNSTRPREYDGSHITFGGMSPEITLREHQLNAIAHILYGGNTLLAHEVGSGKTFEMVAAAMESKRLGLCSKSLIVVPNHLTEQWSSEFLRLYPSANILVARKKDFEPARRKTFCAKIATGDYDAVIIGHSQFEKIPISMERQQKLIEDQIAEIQEGIDELRFNRGERFSIKALEKTKKSLETRLQKLLTAKKKDDVVTFEQLGVDRLFVDEAHGYKNMFLYTKMRNVAGLATTDAQKSSDMYLKCRYLDEMTGGRGVIFATGTPVSNSMTELYTMMRYLQHSTLKDRGWSHFDCWAAQFGETKTVIELAPEGTGYRARTRFAKFYNLPELITVWKEAADVKTADQLNLPRPKAVYHNEVAQPTPHQKELVQQLSERAAEIHAGNVDPSIDNMLKVTSDGRKLGLDQRIINPDLPDDPGSKVNMCVRNILQIWRDGEADKLTQLVFCDISTPKSRTGSSQATAKKAAGNLDSPEIHALERLVEPTEESQFTVYEDIRSKLIADGIPAEEIAFIHDANTDVRKKELFSKVRSGQVRVLMGSTFKMGAGMNVQDRLIALHDLDCPWRPGDLEQRSGRIIRQGNRNPEVHIYRYVTEGTFDSYLWQTVENKQKFISQIMTSKSPVRSCEDVDETALSYAEIKALCAGDPRIKEKMDLDIDVSRLKLLKADHKSQQYSLEDKLIRVYPEQQEKLKGIMANLQADLESLSKHPIPKEGFVGIEVKGDRLTDKDNAGAALLEACRDATGLDPVPIGTYRGMQMSVTLEDFGKTHILTLKGAASHRVELGKDPKGNLVRIENALNEIQARLNHAQAQLQNISTQIETAKAELDKPFPHEAELRQKSERLAELNSILDIDGNTTTSRDENEPVVAKKSRPSILEQLKAPVPHSSTGRTQRKDREAR